MSPTGYPVKWKDKILHLGELTADVKAAFAQWCKPKALAELRDVLDPTEYLHFREQVAGGCVNWKKKKERDPVTGGIAWTTTPSAVVAQLLNDPDGELYYNRLLFGDAVKDWSDEQLQELIEAKLADPKSDYSLAMNLIWETADPKANPGSAPLPAPQATAPLSAPSPESPSICREPTPAA
jgi:hypothetical protein